MAISAFDSIQSCLVVEKFTLKQIGWLFSKLIINPAVAYQGEPCWTWLGYKDKSGYGQCGFNHQVELIHRLVYAWLVGPIPRGLRKNIPQLDHLCRNRSCCNPVHLELVLPRVNRLRSEAASTYRSTKTHCPQGHRYAGKNLYIYRNHRMCKTCRRIRDSKRVYRPRT